MTSDMTRRELEVADLVMLGLRNKEIARRLGLTVGTVKMHLHSIYQKLRISSRMQLAVIMHDANELLPQQPDYNGPDDFARSIDEAYRAIRERKANGGPGWGGWE